MCQKSSYEKILLYYQDKNEKEVGNDERSINKIFNETLGKAQPAQHNQKIVENIENYNGFFSKHRSRASKSVQYKEEVRVRDKLKSMFCIPINSSKLMDTLRLLPSKISSDCHYINYFFPQKYLEQLIQGSKQCMRSAWNTTYYQKAWKQPKWCLLFKNSARSKTFWYSKELLYFLAKTTSFHETYVPRCANWRNYL